MSWGAANARARGLVTHLLDRESLLRAAGAGSWQAAARALVERGYPLDESGAQLTPQEFDLATGRVLADRLALLGRWLGPRRPALAVLYEEAEYRVLRRLLRGAAQGASPGARLRGTTPTPGLPERALELLSRAESPAHLTVSLIRLGHPAGRALKVAGAGTKASELWRLEGALARVFAMRATRAARHAGRAVRRFAATLIDLANAEALLLVSEWGSEVSADDVFLPGGFVLDRARFTMAATLGADRVEAALADWFARTPLGEVFGEAPGPRSFEARALGALLAWQRREGRRDPLGPGIVLEVIERMRAEAHDVRLVSSAADLGAPRAVVAAALVTPA
jgi:vacuolar-type H+-ATPase subunit C/Vma6